jgi:hypothetical protein
VAKKVAARKPAAKKAPAKKVVKRTNRPAAPKSNPMQAETISSWTSLPTQNSGMTESPAKATNFSKDEEE